MYSYQNGLEKKCSYFPLSNIGKQKYVRPSWSIEPMKQSSPLSVADGILGDCVTTEHCRIYFSPKLRSGTDLSSVDSGTPS